MDPNALLSESCTTIINTLRQNNASINSAFELFNNVTSNNNNNINNDNNQNGNNNDDDMNHPHNNESQRRELKNMVQNMSDFYANITQSERIHTSTVLNELVYEVPACDLYSYTDIPFVSLRLQDGMPFHGTISISIIPTIKIIQQSFIEKIVFHYTRRITRHDIIINQIFKLLSMELQTNNISISINSNYLSIEHSCIKNEQSKIMQGKFFEQRKYVC